jgi:hypothetical protein
MSGFAIGDKVWVTFAGRNWPAKVAEPPKGWNGVTLEFDGSREERLEAIETGWYGHWLNTAEDNVAPRSI